MLNCEVNKWVYTSILYIQIGEIKENETRQFNMLCFENNCSGLLYKFCGSVVTAIKSVFEIL